MKDEEHYEKTVFCAYNNLSLAKKSVIAYVTSVSYRSVTSIIDCRGMNLTLSQSKSPCLDWPTCLPVIVLSFKPLAPLTGFYPLPLGETGKKRKTKVKRKGRENTQNRPQFHFSHSVGVIVHLPFSIYYSHLYISMLYLSTY